MPTTPNDLVLMLARVAHEDRNAFSELYSATSAKLYGVVLRILRRRDLADEVLQDVYVRIWQHAGEFEPKRASPITWMATIARNRALDEARRKSARPTETIDEALEVPDPQMLASHKIELSDDNRRINACLSELEGDKREMVLLAYISGWSRQELADRFKHPVATVKTWLHRSLKQLKDCLSS